MGDIPVTGEQPLMGGTQRSRRRFAVLRTGQPPPVFFFFSNRLGCFGSLLLSASLTLVLLLVFDVL